MVYMHTAVVVGWNLSIWREMEAIARQPAVIGGQKYANGFRCTYFTTVISLSAARFLIGPARICEQFEAQPSSPFYWRVEKIVCILSTTSAAAQ